ncbi:unnamed protein product [Rhizophagus irregularis]|nr:unnamed protein product [Rhizophagus irregularis]
MSSRNDIKCKNCNDFYTDIEKKWCKPCQINKVNSLVKNVANWTSGNEKIDNFIQETQLIFYRYDDTIIEWIPYNQFNNIKEISKSNFATIYSAIWNDGPLQHDEHYEELRRVPNKEVVLKRLYNLQNIINDLLYESKLYSIERDKDDYLKIYGISQNPDTKDYILVFNDGLHCLNCGDENEDDECCIPCQRNNLKNNFENWTSGNEKIDEFIQKMQLQIDYQNDIIIEWIPYNLFNDIKEINKSEFTALYSAIWKDGPLKYDENYKEFKRAPNKRIALKHFYYLQNIVNDFLFEIKPYPIDISIHNKLLNIYGISQNPDTNDYIAVLDNGYCNNCGEKYTNIFDKWCKPCYLNNIKINFAIWTRRNEKIDEFIQEKHIKINKQNNIIVEWIPYNQFNNIKEISKSDFTSVYSAIWKDGPLQYVYKYDNGELKRIHNKKVALKCLYNSQVLNNELLNEIKSYPINKSIHNKLLNIYGISQNPDTKDYIIVLQDGFCENCGEIYTNIEKKWCKTCQLNNFKEYFSYEVSGNEKIDHFIQEMQFKISKWSDIIVEWISYDQFDNISKEIGEIGSTTIYSAIWKNGPLQNDKYYGILKRIPDKKVTLKSLHNSQNITNKLLNEIVKEFSIKKRRSHSMFGISQNPDTKDYIIVLDNNYCENCNKIYTIVTEKWCKSCQANNLRKNFVNWTSGNENIDNFIQEMQLKIDHIYDTIVEWIPYNQFNDIKELSSNDSSAVCSAILKRGPLTYYRNKLVRELLTERIFLKYFYDLQNIANEFNEFNEFLNENIYNVYGISQNPDTKDYIIVLKNCCKNCGEPSSLWCTPCQINNLKQNFTNWTSGNKEIDEIIREMQLKIDESSDIIVEWISYNQFNNIKEISNKDDLSIICSAIWEEGLLVYDNGTNFRLPNEKVILKYLCNSQDIINELLNEIKKYTISNSDEILNIYGISQNPKTKDYIVVLKDGFCKNCGEIYTSINDNWCKSCQINNLKQNFTSWTSGNKEIDNFIQQMQFKINNCSDIIVEWIPYSQFNNINKIGEGGFAIVYSAIWKDGPLQYVKNQRKLKRNPNKKVALKCLNNSQNINNEFLNEVKGYSIKNYDRILSLYGISQNPDTKDYVMVLDYADGGDISNYSYINIDWYWFERLLVLTHIIGGLKNIHENNMVHHDFHTGNILLSFGDNTTYGSSSGNLTSHIYISDMGLCGEVGNIDETKIYGVMPYVAPEVLRGKPYTQAADIYSFGMIMYFVATKKQPFANFSHDNTLALNICNGIRPEINEKEAPKFYIDLMKRCWDSNPNNRPSAIEVYELIGSFTFVDDEEIKKQIEEADEYRKANFSNSQLTNHHPQAYYTSRLLNPFTKELPKYDNIDNNSVEIVDFGKISDEIENQQLEEK